MSLMLFVSMQLFLKCFTELRNVSPVGNSLCLLLQTAALERSLGNVSKVVVHILLTKNTGNTSNVKNVSKVKTCLSHLMDQNDIHIHNLSIRKTSDSSGNPHGE